MECSVANDNHWEGQMTLNPADELYYCPKHVTRCTISGCEKKFFDGELEPDFRYGAHCESCPHEGSPYWCDEHIPECQLCDEKTDLCESCAVEVTNGVFSSLCEVCCEGVMDDPCSVALVKRAVSKYESV